MALDTGPGWGAYSEGPDEMRQTRKQRRTTIANRSVRVGGLYRRRLPDGTVELALVRSVENDLAGIPHVRFQLVKEKPFMLRHQAGPRILSLSAFIDR